MINNLQSIKEGGKITFTMMGTMTTVKRNVTKFKMHMQQSIVNIF